MKTIMYYIKIIWMLVYSIFYEIRKLLGGKE